MKQKNAEISLEIISVLQTVVENRTGLNVTT